MKCPGCGKEVVIATDLCPWCGYKYNFDGSIEVKDSPGCFDPGEEEPSARRRRGRRGADPDAEERWVQAGVFGGGAQGGRAEPRAGAAQRGRGAAQRGRGAAPHGSETAARGMKWYAFLTGVLLPLNFIGFLYSGVSTLLSTLSLIADDGGGAIMVIAPWIPMTELAVAVIYIVFGIIVMAARQQLKEMRWSGVTLFISAAVVPTVISFVFRVIWMGYIGYYEGVMEMNAAVVAVVLYAVLNAVYFRRRRELFS